KLWRGKGTTFTAAAVAATGAAVVDTGLDSARVNRLSALSVNLGVHLLPAAAQLARWAEAVAADLAEAGVDADVWADFYDDLSAEKLTFDDVRGRRILIDDQSRLLAVADEQRVF